jgi:hypothetical protein
LSQEPTFIVCADADKAITVRGSSFDRRCWTCGRRVMVSPSSQRLLRQRPKLGILCGACFDKRPDAATATRLLAAPPETIAEEYSTAIPNFWRRRN